MSRKILSLYIFLVLILLSIIPSIYFIQSIDIDYNKSKPFSYTGDYNFYKSIDDKILFARSTRLNQKSPIVYFGDIFREPSYFFEMSISDSIYDHFQFIFPDYRGFGKTDRFKDPWSYSINHFVDDLESLRIELGKSSLILVGHGFGSIVAQKYFLKYPEHVESTIFISPIVSYDNSAKQAAKKLSDQFKLLEDEAVQSTSYFEMEGYSRDDEIGFFGISKIIAHMDINKLWFTDSLNATKLNLEMAINSGFYSNSELKLFAIPSYTIGLLYDLYKTDYLSDFQMTHEKTLFIFGNDDFFSGKQIIKSIQEVNKKKQFQVDSIAKSAYYPFIENPHEFQSVLLKFLKTI